MNDMSEDEFAIDLAYYIFEHDSDILNSPEDLARVIEKYIKELKS